MTPHMCQHTDIIFAIKLLRNFHYELLWEVCNGKCHHLCSSPIHTLSWYLGVNLCEGVLIIGYVERVH